MFYSIKAQTVVSLILACFLLSCQDDSGIVSSEEFVDLVKPRFSVSTDSPQVGAQVFFTDSSRGNIIKWVWTFGNGETSNLQNPTVIYDEEGTYTVSLEITDASGVIEETSRTLDVGPLIIEGAYILTDEDYSFVANQGTSAQGSDMLENLYFNIDSGSDAFWSQSEVVNALNNLLLTKDLSDSDVLPVMFRVFDGEKSRTTFINLSLLEGSYRLYIEYVTVNSDYLFMAPLGNPNQQANMEQFLNFFRGPDGISGTFYWQDSEMIDALSSLLLSKFDEIITGSIYNLDVAYYDGEQKRARVLLLFNGESFELHPDGVLP